MTLALLALIAALAAANLCVSLRTHNRVARNATKETKAMSQITDALTDLKAEVSAGVTVEQSAVALMNGLSKQLADALANEDPAAALAAIADVKTAFDAQKDELAAAVVANTPAQAPAA